MRTVFAYFLGFGLVANGVVMLAIPEAWYAAMPGVTGTGPFNSHFVRDIGAAYLVAGAASLRFAKHPGSRAAAQAGAAFLTLHALVHVWDTVAGREHAHQLFIDIPTVLLPPVLALWIVRPGRRFTTQERHHDQMVSRTANQRF
jgi:hypothetical protein